MRQHILRYSAKNCPILLPILHTSTVHIFHLVPLSINLCIRFVGVWWLTWVLTVHKRTV